MNDLTWKKRIVKENDEWFHDWYYVIIIIVVVVVALLNRIWFINKLLILEYYIYLFIQLSFKIFIAKSLFYI